MSMFGETLEECQSYELSDLRSENEDLKKKLHDSQGRIIELECAIKWLINEKLKEYTDSQYGKGGMRKILEHGCMPVLDPSTIK